MCEACACPCRERQSGSHCCDEEFFHFVMVGLYVGMGARCSEVGNRAPKITNYFGDLKAVEIICRCLLVWRGQK